MTIPDVNVLIHAYNTDFPDHAAARRWWEQALSTGDPAIGLPWAVVLGFLRLTTARTILTKPLRVGEAVAIARSWVASGNVRMVVPGERHGAILFDLLERAGAAGNLTTDAHLAALAIEYRAEIATTDTDFSRFPGLRWFNPLLPARRK